MEATSTDEQILLTYNFLPTDSQTTHFTQLLADAVAELEDVENLMRKLEEKREILRGKASGYRKILSPARKLNRDVLAEIFRLCLPHKHNAIMDKDEPPLVLGQVCKLWRDISHSLPSLWSSLHITQSSTEPQVAQWLERSGSRPLSFSLHFPQSHDSHRVVRSLHVPNHWGKPSAAPRTDWLLELIGLLVKPVHISRWKHIELDIPLGSRAMRKLQLRLPDVLPILESVSFSKNISRDHESFPFIKMLQLPSIRSLSLPTQYPLNWQDFSVTWENLTSVRVVMTTNGREDHVLKFFERCPNLESCAITFPRESYSAGAVTASHSTSSPVLLGKLHSLALEGWHHSEPAEGLVLSYLRLPVLQHLRFVASRHNIDSTINPASFIMNRIDMGHLPLLSFSYKGKWLTELQDFLRHSNSILELELSFIEGDCPHHQITSIRSYSYSQLFIRYILPRCNTQCIRYAFTTSNLSVSGTP